MTIDFSFSSAVIAHQALAAEIRTQIHRYLNRRNSIFAPIAQRGYDAHKRAKAIGHVARKLRNAIRLHMAQKTRNAQPTPHATAPTEQDI